MTKMLLCGEIDVNCYFVENKGLCYIIDPGYEKERIINFVHEKGFKVVGILLTHGHIDHVGAIDCFDVPVYLHTDERIIIESDDNNGFSYHGRSNPCDLDAIDLRDLSDGDQLPLGEKTIEVIHTPGHTPGSICFKIGSDLYTGDTLFEGTVGRWDFPLGNQTTLSRSVTSLIDSLDDEIRILPAHGEASTIGSERRSNPYYLHWKKSSSPD